ncbi:MAG TPA: outer membrane beta-barrel protein [Gemmatimonadaceae bacterium]|nr:outer membrane beta-barrel protein [Gemmatimonadaceae bacterium]
MTKRISAVLASLAFVASMAGAQAPQPLELGVDAGITIGIGDNSITVINIPAQSLRVGFPIGRRTSIEPKLGMTIISGNDDTFTTYQAEVGLLYHLGSGRYPGAYHRAGLYVRPFLGIVGFSGDDSDSDGYLGAGLGFKMPLVSRLSSRFEANFAHQFVEGDANQIGLLAGLSFFTR